MPIGKITKEELNAMDRYRREYAWSNNYTRKHNENYAPIENILTYWNDAKNHYLYRLFENNLILSKPVSYTRSEDEIVELMNRFLYGKDTFGREKRTGTTFINAYRHFINHSSFSADVWGGLHTLLSSYALAKNIYEDNDVIIPLKDGKKYNLRKGCRVSKALGKIAESYNLEGWEDFRICHSQIIGQKEMSGILNISIHPLDYMTMSDNDITWESCMNWRKEGGYRHGTVEMMNSECVVVAYISSETDMKLFDDFSWSNKKWRELFVITPEIITSIKGYPFCNDNISEEILKWLMDLAEKNLDWHYQTPFLHDFTKCSKITIEEFPEDKQTFYMDVDCGFMYDDYECVDKAWIAFGKSFSEEDIDGELNYAHYNIPYSGLSSCMVCGKVCYDDDLTNESCLVCNSCQEIIVCDHCGDSICCPDEAYEVDEVMLCSDCYDNHVYTCSICGEPHYHTGCYDIMVIPRLNESQKFEAMEEVYNIGQHSLANAREKASTIEMIPSASRSIIDTICDNVECINKWIAENLKEGCRLHQMLIRYEYKICVYFDELNDGAKECFFEDAEMTNEDYYKEIKNGFYRVREAELVGNL